MIEKMNPLGGFGDSKGMSQLDFDTENDEDHEINFIEEMIADYHQDLGLQDKLHIIVKNGLDDKKDLSPEDKEEILDGVESLQNNFVKVLNYASFFLE